MTVDVTEQVMSRPSKDGNTNPSHTRMYNLQGSEDHDEVMTALKAAAPGSITLSGKSLKARTYDIGIAQGADTFTWVGIVEYADGGTLRRKPSNAGDSLYSFDTGGGVAHLSQAKAHPNHPDVTQDFALAGSVATNHEGAINVDKDGNVKGVDVIVPKFHFSISHIFELADVNTAYIAKVRELTGTVNNALFNGHDAGECLFLGAVGQRRNELDWNITFRFAGSGNLTTANGNPLQIGNLPDIDKLGWELVWVEYKRLTRTTSGREATIPIEAHLEHMYDLSNFAELGIGT